MRGLPREPPESPIFYEKEFSLHESSAINIVNWASGSATSSNSQTLM
uniref:Uncharacterized protein n=1 Tax=Utricularia reniformis TaxID=192314 RepID=A0A1Y0AZ12_9LAMI|nr:hypothetical protein AEK19_MT1581 [Utricularia reniformis]ART30390.1 hypothetical protein AEK19_MT1581 [Utricularia reniformis]